MALYEFINFLERQVRNHSIYVWSAQGEGYPVISDAWIKRMETSERNAERAIRFWHKQCDLGYKEVLRAFDCSGLGMSFICKYTATQDLTAYGMYTTLCEPIKKSQLKKGDWVFVKTSDKPLTISHVGYVVDEKLNVIESKGRDDGVVKRPLTEGRWNLYGRPKMFKWEIEHEKEAWVVTRVLKKGCKGDDVKELQKRLIQNGHSCGESGADGSFGSATESAVYSYQKAVFAKDPTEWDGIAGKKTLTKLGAVCMW